MPERRSRKSRQNLKRHHGECLHQTACKIQSRHFFRQKLGRTMTKLGYEIAEYAAELERYTERQRLPADWFEDPDHVAFKTANAAHFERFLRDLRAEIGVEGIVVAELDERRIATAILAGPIAVGSFGEV